jgi:putative endonuclease
MNTREIGNKGEDIACTFLSRKGFKVVARNYQRKWGEIDIIAQKAGKVHFVEVKSIRSDFSRVTSAHRPEDNVHAYKLRHIRRMVETYFAENSRGEELLFEVHVLAVYMNERTRRARVVWTENIIV